MGIAFLQQTKAPYAFLGHWVILQCFKEHSAENLTISMYLLKYIKCLNYVGLSLDFGMSRFLCSTVTPCVHFVDQTKSRCELLHKIQLEKR